MLIKIRLRSFYNDDFCLLEKSLKQFQYTIQRTGLYALNVSGPIPLPVKRKILTVNRSVHADNKSKEQFSLSTRKRLWVIRVNLLKSTPVSVVTLTEEKNFRDAWTVLLDSACFDWTFDYNYRKVRTF